MPLSEPQRRTLQNWMQAKGIIQCPACGEERWRFSEATYIRGLLEQGEPDLAEDQGVVKIQCDNCAYVLLLDAQAVGIRTMWDSGRGI